MMSETDATSSSVEDTQTQAPSVSDRLAAAPGKRITRPRVGRRPRIPNLKRWTPVIVTWVDAVTCSEQVHSDDTFDLPIRRSIGHFIKKNNEAITIAMEDDRLHKDPDSDCQTVTSIPLGMIREVVVLTPINK